AVASALVACNAILGLDPQHVRADAGGADEAGAADGGTIDAPGSDGIAPSDASDEDAFTSAYAREVLADKPLMYFRFGEQTGLTAKDEMGAFNATYETFGVTLKVPGAIANDPDTAVALGGQSKISVPHGADFDGTVPYSIELWLRIDAQATNLGFIVDHEAWPDPRHGWDIVMDDQGFSFERYNNGTVTAVGAPALAIARWTHVFYSWDGSTGRAFLDGQLANQQMNAFDIAAIPGGFTIGGQNCECSSTFYTGALDELAIYDHLLSTDRVQ